MPENPVRKKATAKLYRERNRELLAEKYRKWVADNKEKRKASIDRFRKANPGYTTERTREFRKRNPDAMTRYNRTAYEKHGEGLRERMRRNVKELPDYYVGQVLTYDSDLNWKDLPPILIDAKREHLKLRRILK